MGEIRLVAPRIRVIRDGQEPRWSSPITATSWGGNKHGYSTSGPKFHEAPFKWLTFLAWSALRRAGNLEAGVTYERFESEVLSVGDMSGETEDEKSEPLPAGSRTRLIVEIAVATQTAPADWWDEPDEVIATALDVLEPQREGGEKSPWPPPLI